MEYTNMSFLYDFAFMSLAADYSPVPAVPY